MYWEKKPIDYDEVRVSKQFFSLTLTTVLLFPAGWSIEVEWVIVSKNIFQFYGAVVLQYISISLYSENKIAWGPKPIARSHTTNMVLMTVGIS